jgi:hypothetical protein
LEQLIRPPSSLTFAIQSGQVDLTDNHYSKLVFYTDGRKLEKQKKKDDANREISAHWEGTRLVTDEKTPRGSSMSRTFELSSDGRQFFETVHIDRGKSKGLLVIRLVYDAAGAATQATHETDPNQPVMKRRAETSASPSGDSGIQTDQGANPNQPAMKPPAGDGANTSSPPAPPDPDQPVMRRRTDNSNSSSQ